MGQIADRVRYVRRVAELRQRNSDWIGAVEALEAAAAFEPHQSAHFHALGLARWQVWDFDGAYTALSKAVALAPHRRCWWQRLASAYRRREQFRPFSGAVLTHRGNVQGFAENSTSNLAALPETVAGVEVDVRATGDGVPVLMHDPSIDRTTDGSGMVADLRFEKLREFVGRRGSAIPSLDEFLQASSEMALEYLLLDLKAPSPDLFRAVAAEVRASNVSDICVVMVRGEEQMRGFREASRELRLGGFGVIRHRAHESIATAKRYGAEMLLVAHGDERYLENRDAILRIQGAGLLAGASIINGHRALEAARLDNCDVILTDRAEQLRWFVGCG